MNRFCVPYAYAKILGVSPDEIADIIKEGRVQRADAGARIRPRLVKGQVRGVYGWEQERIKEVLGIKVFAKVSRPGMTIGRWAKIRQMHGDTMAWIVRVSGHALVYKDGKFYDNGTPAGASIDMFPHSKRRLKTAEQVDLWDDRNPYEVAR